MIRMRTVYSGLLVLLALALALAATTALAGGDGSTPDRPTMGITVRSSEDGLRIESVRDGSPADEAGIREGDVLVRANLRRLRSADDLRDILSRGIPAVVVTYERDGERDTTVVCFIEQGCGLEDVTSRLSELLDDLLSRLRDVFDRILDDGIDLPRDPGSDDSEGDDATSRRRPMPSVEPTPRLGELPAIDPVRLVTEQLEDAVPELRGVGTSQLIWTEIYVLDENDQPTAVRALFGSVGDLRNDTLTIDPHGPGDDRTFNLDPETAVLTDSGEGRRGDLGEGMSVAVITTGEADDVRAVVMLPGWQPYPFPNDDSDER